ncbi:MULTISPECIES: V-type ATP synthase subunit I [unclassified Carboxylicivirga]|uniref:V-type ATP synthase subunit I n=1 Tax=Carboxylicivirga TaxID=1628153 RepID=UPI003D3294C8
MIKKMKKLLLFMTNPVNDMDEDLTVLGQLGLMHISPFQPAKDDSIDRVQERIEQMERAIDILEAHEGQGADAQARVSDYAGEERGEIAFLEKILDTNVHNAELKLQIDELTNEKQWFEAWGLVAIDDVRALHDKGVFVRLYEVADKDLKNIRTNENVLIAGRSNGVNQVVLISEDKDATLNYHPVEFPKRSLKQVEQTLSEKEAELSKGKQFLGQLSAQKELLKEALVERKRRLKVRLVQYGGVSFYGKLRCWEGFVPEDQVSHITDAAEENGWGYMVKDPRPDEYEQVPTLLENPGWTHKIKPVMNFMGLVPGYDEIDVSKVFLIFFTFFTGILVGDAGYGLIFFALTLLVHWKQGFTKQIEFGLMYTLSASIMTWGVLTGTYFGVEAIANIPFLKQLQVQQLASFGGDNLKIQQFMFLIGAVHLSIGHLQKGWKYMNSVIPVAQLGWVSIVWGLYFLVNQMVLGIEGPVFMPWMFIGGAVLVALFSTPGQPLFKGMLSSLGNLPLNVINGFSDVISYIRLYAVGLSTVLMATSFNDMAIGEGITTLASGIGAVIILVLGHALNMTLAAMAVLVHGVRLNMLEYAGHASVEFSGSEYNPFKLKNK